MAETLNPSVVERETVARVKAEIVRLNREAHLARKQARQIEADRGRYGGNVEASDARAAHCRQLSADLTALLAAQASTRQAAEQALALAREALERIADQMPATHEVTILTQVCGLASEALAALPRAEAEAGEKGECSWPDCGCEWDAICNTRVEALEPLSTDTGAGGDHG